MDNKLQDITKEEKYAMYCQILKEELVPAMGCTEPIAIAYCAATARQYLGAAPEEITVYASGNIIKNVKSVIVPNTNGLKGIPAAAVAGIVAGKPEKKLEVIAEVSEAQKQEMAEVLQSIPCEVKVAENGKIFDIKVVLKKGTDQTAVRIVDFHSNIVSINKNGQELLEKERTARQGCSDVAVPAGLTDHSVLNIKDIIAFADEIELDGIAPVLKRQISYNMAIAEEGLRGNYGANVGSVLLEAYGNDIKTRARAMAAAGSDARMNGCELPVIINSGSGNQGITASVPVITYARELKTEEEKLYRALLVSNLVTIHLKTGIGRLSAYCGAVSAGCGSGAGIAYLLGGDFGVVAHTIVNSLAIVSGIVCDGAKASCAGKIASAVDAGILGYHMYLHGKQFRDGDGIVAKGVENTIRNVGILGSEGMKETDKEILKIMLGEV